MIKRKSCDVESLYLELENFPKSNYNFLYRSHIQLKKIEISYTKDGVTYNYKNSDEYIQAFYNAIDAKQSYETFYSEYQKLADYKKKCD